MILRKTFRFEASHRLPKHPGKCRRLHGHSWVLHVYVHGSVNPATGFVMDYGDISAAVKPLIEDLDHKHLGSWDGIEWNKDWDCPWSPFQNPTSENLLFAIGGQLLEVKFDWDKLALEETCTSYAELTIEEFNAQRRG